MPPKKEAAEKVDPPAHSKPVMIIPLDNHDGGELDPQTSLTQMDETKKLQGRVLSVAEGRITIETVWGPLEYSMQSVCYRLETGASVVFEDNPVNCFDTSIRFEHKGAAEQCWIYCLE